MKPPVWVASPVMLNTGEQISHRAAAALAACADCHTDANKNSYNGRQVSTPHGGTFGYPVVDGKWKWKGLNDSDWARKQISITRLPEDTE